MYISSNHPLGPYVEKYPMGHRLIPGERGAAPIAEHDVGRGIMHSADEGIPAAL